MWLMIFLGGVMVGGTFGALIMGVFCGGKVDEWMYQPVMPKKDEDERFAPFLMLTVSCEACPCRDDCSGERKHNPCWQTIRDHYKRNYQTRPAQLIDRYNECRPRPKTMRK